MRQAEQKDAAQAKKLETHRGEVLQHLRWGNAWLEWLEESHRRAAQSSTDALPENQWVAIVQVAELELALQGLTQVCFESVCACVCVCKYVCKYMCVCVSVSLHVRACMYVCLCVRIYVSARARARACVCIFMCVYLYVFVLARPLHSVYHSINCLQNEK